MKKGDIVKIDWIDSFYFKDGWMEIKEEDLEVEPIITTIGKILHITDHRIALAASSCEVNSSVTGLMVIPKGAILFSSILENAKN